MPDASKPATLEESPFAHVQHAKKRAMLTAYRETCNVRLAAELAETSTTSHYRWLQEDPEYHRAYQIAQDDAADLLEAEAWRRAVKGVEKPVGFYKGEAGGYVTEYSDTLLIFLLKGARPSKYAERVRLHGQIANLDMGSLPNAVLARISKGEDPYAVLVSHFDSIQHLLPGSESEDE